MTDLLTEPAPPSATDSGPLTSQSEIDRLLDEAQNLASEIAEQVRLEGEEPPLVATDKTPIEAETPVGGDATSQIAGEASSAPGTMADSGPAPATSEPPQDALQEAAPTQDATSAPEGTANTDTTLTSDAPPEIASVTNEPPEVPAAESSALIEQATVAPPTESTLNSPAIPAPDAASDSPIPSTRQPLLRRLTAVAVWPLWLIPRTGLHILILFDRPFARLSPLTKQRIGWVAITTLLMAGLARILPEMMKSNPYEHITDFPPAAASESGHASSDDHSGGAKSGSEKKPEAHH